MNGKDWFLYVVDHHEGPFTAEEIQGLIDDGKAKKTSYVWKDGMADWAMLSDILNFGGSGPGTDGHGAPSFNDLGGTGPGEGVWCLNSKKTFSGPYSMKTLVRKINAGEASIHDSVWKEGWSSFVPISKISQFMSEISPDAAAGKKVKKNKSAVSAIKALGFGGSPAGHASTRFSGKTVVFLIVVTAALYQLAASGTLDPVLDRLSLTSRVHSLNLPPMKFDAADEILTSVRPMARSLGTNLPEPLKSWLTGIQLPDGLAEQEAQLLSSTALSPLQSGAKISVALPAGSEVNPSFVIATNLPDGSNLAVHLRNKPRSLLNAAQYEKLVMVEVKGGVVKTPPFTFEGSKSLPRGEYFLSIYDSPQQGPEVAAQLANLPKKSNSPDWIPQHRTVFTVDTYFLGGKKDAVFAQRLREYNERVDAKLQLELGELRQLESTIESMVNDGTNRFLSISRLGSPAQRKNAWNEYNKRRSRLASQLRAATQKNDPQRYLAPLYHQLAILYQLTENLHLAETRNIEKGQAAIGLVKDNATRVFEVVTSFKNELSKAGK